MHESIQASGGAGVDAVVALGANLGDRRQALERACRALEGAGMRILRRSRLYWTRPMGGIGQPVFLNAAVVARSGRRPVEMLQLLLAVEHEMGRRRGRRWGARTIDLDLLLYGGVRTERPGLTLPHPGLARRDFVLAPLIDLGVAPDPAAAPRGWSVLLGALPRQERTILHCEAWEPIACAGLD